MVNNKQLSFSLKQGTLPNAWVFIILVALGTSPDIFLDQSDDRNIFLILVMLISPLVLLFSRKIFKLDLILITFLCGLFFSAIVINPEFLRWSTLFYTSLFAVMFLAYEHCLARNFFSIVSYLNTLKFLMLVFFWVLVTQQISVFFGLPVLLAGNYNPEYPWKLSSLAAEPSHAAFTVSLLMFSYSKIKNSLLKKNQTFYESVSSDKAVWLAYFWFCLTSNSTSALFLMIILLTQFLHVRSIPSVLFISFFLCIGLLYFEGIAIDRATSFFFGLITLNPDAMLAADHSGSLRFVPAIVIFDKVSIFGLNGLFGHGIDYVKTFLYLEIPGIEEDFATGGIMLVWLEYGFVAFLLFILFSIQATGIRFEIVPLALWFIFLFLGNGINTQLVWLLIVIFHTNNFFLGKKFKAST